MVNLRSRKIGNEGTTPRQNQEIGSASKAKKSKTALQRTTSFLKSPHVRTRATGPAPEISLSTELPKLADIPGYAQLQAAEANPSVEEEDDKPAPARGTDVLSPPGEGRVRPSHTDAQDTSSRDLDEASSSSEDKDEQAAGGEHMRSLLKIKPSSDHEQEDHGQPSSPENDDLGEAETSNHQEKERLMQRSDAVLANLSTVHARYRGSDSESSEAESEEEFSDLARSMWSALQKAHGAAETAEVPSRQTSKSREKQADTSGPDKSQPSAERDLSWQPKHGLPSVPRSGDLSKLSDRAEPELNKQLMAAPRDKQTLAAQQAANKERNWHDLPEQVITDELKRDLRLLRLRGAMDTKRFYKKADKGKFPSRFAIGTVIADPTEFFSGRLTNKERKQTITDELLADPNLQASRKRRFGKIQEESQRWSWKKHRGSGERIKPKQRNTKH